eukprot:2706999-Pyramimonas_sp.AAC.1
MPAARCERDTRSGRAREILDAPARHRAPPARVSLVGAATRTQGGKQLVRRPTPLPGCLLSALGGCGSGG